MRITDQISCRNST